LIIIDKESFMPAKEWHLDSKLCPPMTSLSGQGKGKRSNERGIIKDLV
jgi:hypothetical protein